MVSGEERPRPYTIRILGVFPLDYIGDVVAPMSEDPKLIVRAITFEVVQPICPACIHQRRRQTDGTDGRTDGRTTYDSNTALALSASRGKNSNN